MRATILSWCGKPALVEGRDVGSHVGGRDDEVLEWQSGTGRRNTCEHPEEARTKGPLGFHTDTACLRTGHEGLDLDMDELGALAITAQDISVRRVAHRDDGSVSPSA